MKTPGLYQVPEPRNLLNFIFCSIFGAFLEGEGGMVGALGGQMCGEWSRMKRLTFLMSSRIFQDSIKSQS